MEHGLFLLCFITTIISAQNLESPCPNFFKYEQRNESSEPNRWYGVIQLSTDVELHSIWIDIELDRPANLLANWFGEVTSPDSRVFTITNRKTILLPGFPTPIRFFVNYGETDQIPVVTNILLNGRIICPPSTRTQLHFATESSTLESATDGPIRQFSTTTAKVIDLNQNDSASVPPINTRNSISSSVVKDLSTQKPLEGYSVGVSSSTPVNKAECGVVISDKGSSNTEGQWPWHAVIYKSSATELARVCGGSLISLKHVVTAAHCVAENGATRPIQQDSLQIYLGKHNLQIWANEGVQVKTVEEILIHPQYNHTDFKNNLAVLKFNTPAEYTNFVRPVCLWRDVNDFNSIVYSEGTVPGWGFEMLNNNQLEVVKLPVVSQQTCIWSNPNFFSNFTSENTYCAGYKNAWPDSGPVVCQREFGGGMVFPIPETDPVVWRLRGLMSLSVAYPTYACDAHNYVVFTDLAKYQNWLLSIVSEVRRKIVNVSRV